MAALTTGKILEYGWDQCILCTFPVSGSEISSYHNRAVRTMGGCGGAGLGWGGNPKEEEVELVLQHGPGVERMRASPLGVS